MKKQWILRSMLGAPLGLAIGYVISIIVSLVIGDGSFHAAHPQLAAALGGELKAVIVQAVVLMVYGGIWAGASTIFEQDEWSILRQTVTHLAVTSLATLPVAYTMRWMERSPKGIALYFGIFLVIYFVIWLGQYLAVRKRLAAINERVQEKNLEK
jgi:cation transport ATPase